MNYHSKATAISESKSMSMHSTRGKKLKRIAVEPALNWSPDKMRKYKADLYVAKYTGGLNELKTKSIDFDKK